MIAQCLAAGASPAHDRARYLAPTTPSTRPPSTSTPPAIGFFGAIRAIRAAARLTSTERLVLLVIASHADNRTGEAWPSIPTLAAECGFTTRTIERTIAALAAAGWLARDSAASRWGTNVYRVTPRPDDVRPPSPRRYGRPFDRATPDRASGDPPSPVRVTPDTRSADLLLWDLHEGSAVNAAPPPRGPHTQPDFEVDQEHETHEAPAAAAELVDVEPVVPEGPVEPVDVEPVVPPAGVHETAVELVDVEPVVPEAAAWRPGPLPLAAVAMSSAHQLRESDSLGAVAKRSAKRDASTVVPEGPVEPAILDALAAHPELRALARPPVAALLAAEGRPLPVLRRALGELAEHARDAAAVGEPWSASTLIRKARAYVRRAYADPVTSSTSTPAPEPPPPPPRLDATVAELRAFRAALAAGPSTPPRRRR